jgi:hypothetical protein
MTPPHSTPEPRVTITVGDQPGDRGQVGKLLARLLVEVERRRAKGERRLEPAGGPRQ